MVLSKIRVSQNFCEISQVSQSRFLRGLSASQSLKFLQGTLVTIDLRSRILEGKKVLGSQRKTPVSPSHSVSLLPFATPKYHHQNSRFTKKFVLYVTEETLVCEQSLCYQFRAKIVAFNPQVANLD